MELLYLKKNSLIKVTGVLVLLIGFLLNGLNASSQATLNAGFNAPAFEAELEVNNCVDVTGVSLTCGTPATQSGVFSNGIAGAALEIDRGIFLTTGDAVEAFTSNSDAGISAGGGAGGTCVDTDLDLLDLGSLGTFDEAIVEFDFVMPTGADGIRIPFQFASDEYPEYVCSQFNDVFGFFISGGALVGTQNIALVPVSGNPVAVNSINIGTCGAFADGTPADLTQGALFIDNNDGVPGPIFCEYDGVTVTLYASITGLTAGVSYHFKMAIGDIGDGSWDSGVWVGAIEALDTGGLPVDCGTDTDGDGLTDCEENSSGSNN